MQAPKQKKQEIAVIPSGRFCGFMRGTQSIEASMRAFRELALVVDGIKVAERFGDMKWP